ncbi:MAG TPA: hypothetical protein VGF46_03455 [Gaiellales bacterium]|jgi:hypothetical protein
MTETPRIELPSLLAQSDQVARTGYARQAARDGIERADRDYELELHSRERSEEVIESERISSTDGERHKPDDDRPKGDRRPSDDDPDDEGTHLVDLIA